VLSEASFHACHLQESVSCSSLPLCVCVCVPACAGAGAYVRPGIRLLSYELSFTTLTVRVKLAVLPHSV